MLDEYEILWNKLGYKKPLYPLNTKPKHDYTPHIEYGDGKYQWFVTEYGAWRDYRETTDVKRALEWLAVDIVCHIVNRITRLDAKGEKEHRIWFQ